MCANHAPAAFEGVERSSNVYHRLSITPVAPHGEPLAEATHDFFRFLDENFHYLVIDQRLDGRVSCCFRGVTGGVRDHLGSRVRKCGIGECAARPNGLLVKNLLRSLIAIENCRTDNNRFIRLRTGGRLHRCFDLSRTWRNRYLDLRIIQIRMLAPGIHQRQFRFLQPGNRRLGHINHLQIGVVSAFEQSFEVIVDTRYRVRQVIHLVQPRYCIATQQPTLHITRTGRKHRATTGLVNDRQTSSQALQRPRQVIESRAIPVRRDKLDHRVFTLGKTVAHFADDCRLRLIQIPKGVTFHILRICRQRCKHRNYSKKSTRNINQRVVIRRHSACVNAT